MAAIVLAAAAAILLAAGILYGFAAANARPGGAEQRFRLLGQAANPFIAALALGACGLVVHHRRSRKGDGAGLPAPAFASAAMAVGATVGFATVLIAVNAFILDLTGDGSASFKLSAAISRLATILLAVYAVWLAAVTPASIDADGG